MRWRTKPASVRPPIPGSGKFGYYNLKILFSLSDGEGLVRLRRHAHIKSEHLQQVMEHAPDGRDRFHDESAPRRARAGHNGARHRGRGGDHDSGYPAGCMLIYRVRALIRALSTDSGAMLSAAAICASLWRSR